MASFASLLEIANWALRYWTNMTAANSSLKELVTDLIYDRHHLTMVTDIIPYADKTSNPY